MALTLYIYIHVTEGLLVLVCSFGVRCYCGKKPPVQY
jgi:hypothetical protein